MSRTAPAAAAGKVVVGSAPWQRARRGAIDSDGGRIRAGGDEAVATEEARFDVLGVSMNSATNGAGSMSR